MSAKLTVGLKSGGVFRGESYEFKQSRSHAVREALTADLCYGPAHNNLGVLYLKQDSPKLYEAAGEFEWARKLMPGHPDPRLNLSLTLERAGRIDDALSTYETALEVYPDYLPAVEGIARLQVRYNKQDERTPKYLADITTRTPTTFSASQASSSDRTSASERTSAGRRRLGRRRRGRADGSGAGTSPVARPPGAVVGEAVASTTEV